MYFRMSVLDIILLHIFIYLFIINSETNKLLFMFSKTFNQLSNYLYMTKHQTIYVNCCVEFFKTLTHIINIFRKYIYTNIFD